MPPTHVSGEVLAWTSDTEHVVAVGLHLYDHLDQTAKDLWWCYLRLPHVTTAVMLRAATQ